MTREEAIKAILQMGEGLGPLSDWKPEDPGPPWIDGYTVDEWIARTASEDLDAFVSLVASPPADKELLRFGNKYFLEEYPEDLYFFLGHWAHQDSAAFWEKIGPLLQYPESRRRALECCSFASGPEGLIWLEPLAADIEQLVEAEQLLVIQSVWAVSGKEALDILKELELTVELPSACHYELMNAIAQMSQYD